MSESGSKLEQYGPNDLHDVITAIARAVERQSYTKDKEALWEKAIDVLTQYSSPMTLSRWNKITTWFNRSSIYPFERKDIMHSWVASGQCPDNPYVDVTVVSVGREPQDAKLILIELSSQVEKDLEGAFILEKSAGRENRHDEEKITVGLWNGKFGRTCNFKRLDFENSSDDLQITLSLPLIIKTLANFQSKTSISRK